MRDNPPRGQNAAKVALDMSYGHPKVGIAARGAGVIRRGVKMGNGVDYFSTLMVSDRCSALIVLVTSMRAR